MQDLQVHAELAEAAGVAEVGVAVFAEVLAGHGFTTWRRAKGGMAIFGISAARSRACRRGR